MPGGTLLAALGVVSFSFSFPATAWALEGVGLRAVTAVRACITVTQHASTPRSRQADPLIFGGERASNPSRVIA